jgi:hypothetical protein
MELAGPACVLFLIELSIVVLLPLLNILSGVALGYFARTCGTGFVVDPEAYQSHASSECDFR